MPHCLKRWLSYRVSMVHSFFFSKNSGRVHGGHLSVALLQLLVNGFQSSSNGNRDTRSRPVSLNLSGPTQNDKNSFSMQDRRDDEYA
jgi:hypothetical protein